MFKKYKAKNLEMLKGTGGLFCILFWTSVILTLTVFILSNVVLFLNPNQLSNFKANQDVFLGYYNICVDNNKLYLNWIAYVFGIANIVIVIINCLMYWLFVKISISNFINKRYLMVNLMISVIMSISFFVLNMFNRPLFDYDSLSLINNQWNLNVSETTSSMNFNYVFDINFVTDGSTNLTSYLRLNNFSIIWIIAIIVAGISYVTTLLLLLYNKRCSLSILTYKEV